MNKKILLVVITTLLLLISYAQKSTINYGDNAKAGKYASIRGIKMYYEIYGTGKPLLIIHGNGGSIKDFALQIPYFSQQYKVILADSRSHGKSVDTGEVLNYEMMADDLNALLNYLQLDSCLVIGWSDGGINGLLLAMHYPAKVKKLAFTGANLRPDTTAVEPSLHRWLAHSVDSLSRETPTPEVKHQYKLWSMMTKEPNISLEQLKKVKCPTLVIGGDHDALLPAHTLQIASAITQSYLWIVPNSGHAPLVRYSKLFNETVNTFFKQPYRVIEGLDRLN